MPKQWSEEDPDWNWKDDSFCSDFDFTDASMSDYESDSPQSTLEYEYYEYESLLDHQNSMYTTNAFQDAFGIFGKYLAQFKTVIEQPQVVPTIEHNAENEVPILNMPFHCYLNVQIEVKDEKPVESCLLMEEIIIVDDENPESPSPNETTLIPLEMPRPLCASTPFTSTIPSPFKTSDPPKTPKGTPRGNSKIKSLGKKISSILNYFKPVNDGNNNNSKEIVGVDESLKRKRSNEMDDEEVRKEQENINPAKKALMVN